MEWRQIRSGWKAGEGARGRTEAPAASDDETPSVSKDARKDDENRDFWELGIVLVIKPA